MPIIRRSDLESRSRRSEPSSRMRPAVGRRTADQVGDGRLARARRPTSASISPRLTTRSMPCSTSLHRECFRGPARRDIRTIPLEDQRIVETIDGRGPRPVPHLGLGVQQPEYRSAAAIPCCSVALMLDRPLSGWIIEKAATRNKKKRSGLMPPLPTNWSLAIQMMATPATVPKNSVWAGQAGQGLEPEHRPEQVALKPANFLLSCCSRQRSSPPGCRRPSRSGRRGHRPCAPAAGGPACAACAQQRDGDMQAGSTSSETSASFQAAHTTTARTTAPGCPGGNTTASPR